MTDTSEPIYRHLTNFLSSRQYPKTVCPSEIARALSQPEIESVGANSWRDVMPQVRKMAFELRNSGTVEILQKGEAIPQSTTNDTVVGPIRLRKVIDSPS